MTSQSLVAGAACRHGPERNEPAGDRPSDFQGERAPDSRLAGAHWHLSGAEPPGAGAAGAPRAQQWRCGVGTAGGLEPPGLRPRGGGGGPGRGDPYRYGHGSCRGGAHGPAHLRQSRTHPAGVGAAHRGRGGASFGNPQLPGHGRGLESPWRLAPGPPPLGGADWQCPHGPRDPAGFGGRRLLPRAGVGDWHARGVCGGGREQAAPGGEWPGAPAA